MQLLLDLENLTSILIRKIKNISHIKNEKDFLALLEDIEKLHKMVPNSPAVYEARTIWFEYGLKNLEAVLFGEIIDPNEKQMKMIVQMEWYKKLPSSSEAPAEIVSTEESSSQILMSWKILEKYFSLSFLGYQALLEYLPRVKRLVNNQIFICADDSIIREIWKSRRENMFPPEQKEVAEDELLFLMR